MGVGQAVVMGMPRLSDSMTEGTVIEWLVADGAQVARGEPVAEIETDKATMPYEAGADGWLRILVEAGSTLAVGTPIAEIHPSPYEDVGEGRGSGESTIGESAGASPVARRLAARLGIDLAAIPGTGPRGRVLKRDVQQSTGDSAGSEPVPAVSAASARDLGTDAPAETVSAKGAVERIALNRSQETVARRMSQSKATAPEFAVSVDVEMSAALELRAQLKELPGASPSVNDLIVKACALTLREHPKLNGAYRDGEFELFERVNIGVAVTAESTLVVPTVFDADKLSLAAIAAQTRRLVAAVRDGTVTPRDLAGGTFTVSNLGMFGVRSFTAVLNPPQAGILSVGGIRREPRFGIDDVVIVGQTLTATLVADHRIVYGAEAAQFLAAFRARIETPLQLLL